MSTKPRTQFRQPNLSTQTPVVQHQEPIVQHQEPVTENRQAAPPAPDATDFTGTLFSDEQPAGVDVAAIRIAFSRLEKLTIDLIVPSSKPPRLAIDALKRELPRVLRLLQNALPEDEDA